MFVCKAHGSLNRFPLRLCVISTKPSSFSDKVCWSRGYDWSSQNGWLGTVFKGDWGPALCHGQVPRDSVQNLKAKCTNLSWGPGRTSGALLGDPLPALTGLCSFGGEGMAECLYHPQGVGTDPGDLLAPQMSSHSPSGSSVQQDLYLPPFLVEWQQQESRGATAPEQWVQCPEHSWVAARAQMIFVHAEPRAFAWELPKRITKRFGSWAAALVGVDTAVLEW